MTPSSMCYVLGQVLEDDGVIDHSKVFVAEVVTDDSVQRTGKVIQTSTIPPNPHRS